MATLTIPRNLADDVAGSDDDERRIWLAALPRTIAQLSDRWSLTVGEPYSPGGSCSWVAPALMGGARLVVESIDDPTLGAVAHKLAASPASFGARIAGHAADAQS